jgi:hypothetical protein
MSQLSIESQAGAGLLWLLPKSSQSSVMNEEWVEGQKPKTLDIEL